MIRKKIYEDVLDDIDEITTTPFPEEDEGHPFVTEMFDMSSYSFFVRMRVPRFRSDVPEQMRTECASAIASFITDIFTDVSLSLSVSPIYVYGQMDGFGKLTFLGNGISPYDSNVMFFFGFSFGRTLTLRQCIRIISRLDAVSKFVLRKTGIETVSNQNEFDVSMTDQEKIVLKTNVAARTMRDTLSQILRGRVRPWNLMKICWAMTGKRVSERRLMDALEKTAASFFPEINTA